MNPLNRNQISLLLKSANLRGQLDQEIVLLTIDKGAQTNKGLLSRTIRLPDLVQAIKLSNTSLWRLETMVYWTTPKERVRKIYSAVEERAYVSRISMWTPCGPNYDKNIPSCLVSYALTKVLHRDSCRHLLFLEISWMSFNLQRSVSASSPTQPKSCSTWFWVFHTPISEDYQKTHVSYSSLSCIHGFFNVGKSLNKKLSTSILSSFGRFEAVCLLL